MPVKIVDKANCTACAACANICPQNCIAMKPDEQGFCYPQIDVTQCVSCELCSAVCPVLTGVRNGIPQIQNLDVYAAYSKDESVRESSSSGGVFSELAFPVLRQGGLVAGAGFSNAYEVEHQIVDCEEDLARLRKAKYVQSKIGLLFREIKKQLLDGRSVLFSGTPCQVAGLHNYLGKEYKNLILIDLICHSINSPKAYVYWLKGVEEEYNKNAVQVEFRHKIDGWRKSGWRTKVRFEDGSYTIISKTEGTFMGGFLKGNLFTRPSCGDCKFKGANRVSDLTIADFWGIPSEINDDKGMSQTIVNTPKGRALFESIQSRIVWYKRNYREVLENNPMYMQSAVINSNSETFLCNLGKESFSQLMNKYFVLP